MKKLVCLIILGTFIFTSCGKPEVKVPEVHSITGNTMGTTYSIKIVKNDSSVTDEVYSGLKPDIANLLKEVNKQMSTYMPNSEISRFNNYSDTNWFPISPSFAEVVSSALEIGTQSDSALDITIGALVNLWGFGPDKREDTVPNLQEIELLRSSTGVDKIEVKTSPASIRKKIPEIYIDLSAIAKGYAVDKVAEFIESKGIENYMVEIGGEVRTKDLNQKGEPWKIGISTPDATMGIQKVINLSNGSMATSGDYRNYFEKNGIRYSHTIDPRTGYPITHKLASVTVVHQSCMMADGYATAIDVLGPELGLEFAYSQNLAVFMIVKEGDKFVEKMTKGFESYIVETESEK